MPNQLKPDYLFTARAIRKHTNRLGHGSHRQFELTQSRLHRLHRLFQNQIKNTAARAKANYILAQIKDCAEIAQRITPPQIRQKILEPPRLPQSSMDSASLPSHVPNPSVTPHS